MLRSLHGKAVSAQRAGWTPAPMASSGDLQRVAIICFSKRGSPMSAFRIFETRCWVERAFRISDGSVEADVRIRASARAGHIGQAT